MRVTTRFNPKIYELKSGYNKSRFIKDFGSGLTVSVVALPLAMAFAIASGLPPESGIFTAIIAGFFISLFSGSRVQIGGPAGAFIVIVYGIVQKYGVDGLIVATIMSGVMLWGMGFLRMGSLIKFIPVSVIIGFTNGIAVLIALSQVKEFLGLTIDGSMPADFFEQLETLYVALPTWNPSAVFVALFTLVIILLWLFFITHQTTVFTGFLGVIRGFLSLFPGSIVALVAATVVCYSFGLQVETIGSRFGGIPQGLPAMKIPSCDWDTIRMLFIPASTLAILGAIESLLCARVADGLIRDKHDSNQELLAQGFANMIVPFFGGMPATGTIARTMTNIKNGGRSPIAGMVHALGLLTIVLAAAPLAQYIPLSALSAILLFVAWNMGEWREFVRLKKFPIPYRVSLLAVFLLTVIIDLTVAVQVGIVFACLTFIIRISNLSEREEMDLSLYKLKESDVDIDKITAYHLSGALFFGAVKLIDEIQDQKNVQKTIILDFSGVIYMDSSGGDAIGDLLHHCSSEKITLYVCGLRQQPRHLLERIGWHISIGEDNMFNTIEDVMHYLHLKSEKIKIVKLLW